MELKTLEDLQKEKCNECSYEYFDFAEDLKQEAIKWIKSIDNDLTEASELMRKTTDISVMERSSRLMLIMTGMRRCFINFFNITEENLK